MRVPNRIEPFLEELGKLWKEFPDWRFGQLVYNLFGSDPFYLEDGDALKRIESFLANLDNSTKDIPVFDNSKAWKAWREHEHKMKFLERKEGPLTKDEFRELARTSGFGQHIWIQELEENNVITAITGYHKVHGAIAIWCADIEVGCMLEEDYGDEWIAFLSPPPEW